MRKGSQHSQATKDKISSKLTGRTHTMEQKRRIGDSNRIHPESDFKKFNKFLEKLAKREETYQKPIVALENILGKTVSQWLAEMSKIEDGKKRKTMLSNVKAEIGHFVLLSIAHRYGVPNTILSYKRSDDGDHNPDVVFEYKDCKVALESKNLVTTRYLTPDWLNDTINKFENYQDHVKLCVIFGPSKLYRNKRERFEHSRISIRELFPVNEELFFEDILLTDKTLNRWIEVIAESIILPAVEASKNNPGLILIGTNGIKLRPLTPVKV